jgi:UDP-N-acetyl-2-amino-2-deoxyglucuronate dehydrogenase
LLGPVEEVFGYCTTRSHERIEVEDIAVASIKFKSGALGMIEGNTTAYPGFCSRLDIYGEGGSVIIENDQITEWKLRSGKGCEQQLKSGQVVGNASPEISHHSHLVQIEDMVEAIREDREPLVNGEEARKTLQIILAIYESAATGKPVKIE